VRTWSTGLGESAPSALILTDVYLLDTNIVSLLDPRRREHAPGLVEWMERNGASLFLSVMTITELDAGVLKLRRERKAERADEIAGLVTAILTDFGDRVLTIDIETARHVARLDAASYQQPVALPDLFIAATAARHGLILLTRNMSEFSRLGVPARDPSVELPADT
jgi:predicted nucleic acid-binding protein